MRKIHKFISLIRQDGARQALQTTGKYILNKILGRYIRARYGSGIDVMEKDWDNLIILDAYRYDYFKKYSRFDGELSPELSKGPTSSKFIRRNFYDGQFHDTVYVTANPFAKSIDKDVFYTIEFLLDEWDSEKGTVLPSDVTEAAIAAQKKYPNKRLIVHYMQPHDPHLGPTAQSYQREIEPSTDSNGRSNTMVHWPEKRYPELYNMDIISKKELRKSYIETIEIVEESVEALLSELPGKTVITSDHGENLGEKKLGMTFLEHNNNTSECWFVPWLELPYDYRKSTTAEEPIGFEQPGEKQVKDRLRQLGYR